MVQKALPFAVGACIALIAIFFMDRGVYVGSYFGTNTSGFFFKRCKYLFVTGVADLPASGGLNASIPQYPKGVQIGTQEPDSLYCRFTAE